MAERDGNDPSDAEALAALQARADRASASERSAAAAVEARQQLARDKDARRAQRKAVEGRRAPTGLGATMHGFIGGFGILLLLAVTLGAWSEGDLARFSRPLIGVAVALVLYLGAAWAWMSLWRRGLRYRLIGYDRIEGVDTTDDRKVPWIAFEVYVFLQRDDAAARRAAVLALEILASRANEMGDGDDDAHPDTSQRWTVTPEALVARGESWKAIYITGLFRKWLRSELNDVARQFPVASVEIHARYTGFGFRIPLSTS
jgi:hypothetical protein